MWHRLPTLWLAPNLFIAALRLHLGLAVLPAQGRCPFCNTTREGLEQHALDCMRGGGRQRAHTSIKQAAFVAASAAQWAPRLESSPFVGSTGRIDIDCFWLGERLLGDTAIVSVNHNLAAATPGGAATAYEATKHAKYDAAAAETDRTMQVMPLVWDTFGAAGETAASFMRRVAVGAAHRFSLPHSRVIGIMRERLAARVVAGIAAIAAEADWRVDTATQPVNVERRRPRRTQQSAAQLVESSDACASAALSSQRNGLPVDVPQYPSYYVCSARVCDTKTKPNTLKKY